MSHAVQSPASMGSPPADLITRALAILPTSDAERAEAEVLARAFEPGHGLRAIFTRELVTVLKADAPQALADYERFGKLFAPCNPFAFMPLGEVLLRVCYTAKLCAPHAPLWEATDALLTRSTGYVFENPAMQIARRAAGDDLRAFIEMTMTGDDRFGNYIQHRELTILGPTHLEIRSFGSYPALDRVLSVPYMRSAFSHFRVVGEVTLEAASPRESVLNIAWR